MRPDAILLDGLTLRSSERLLYTTARQKLSSYYDHPLRHVHSDKFNYEMYAAFRFGLDLICLGQLVQTIITAEHIAYDGANNSMLGMHSEFRMSQPSPNSLVELQPILKPVRLASIDRIELLRKATLAVKRYARSGALLSYMKLMAESGLEGAFFLLSSTYFGTGFSDPTNASYGVGFHHAADVDGDDDREGNPFGDLDKEEKYLRGVESLTRKIETAIESQKAAVAARDARASLLWFRRIVSNKVRLYEWEKSVELYSQVNRFIDSQFSRELLLDMSSVSSIEADFSRSGPDVLRHALATQFYSFLSDFLGVPYLAHPLRSQFNSFDLLARTVGLRPLIQRIEEMCLQSRAQRVEVIRSLFGDQLVSVRIPLFLAMVLNEARSSTDVLRAAMALRYSRDAIKFRDWIRKLSMMALDGTGAVTRFEQEVKRLQRLLAEWSGDPSAKSQIDISIPLIVTVKKTFTIPDRILGRRSHLRLLQSLSDISNNTSNLVRSVARVFGTDAGTLWKTYTAAVEPAIAGNLGDVALPIKRKQ